MIKEKLLKYKFFQWLVDIKLILKGIIQSTKFMERKYDNKSLSDFDSLINNPNYIYEKEIEYLPSIIKAGSTVFDIGANRGEYSYYFSKFVGDNGAVYAFEPGNRAFGLLEKIKEKYQLDCLKTNKLALSDKAGTHTLIVPYFNRQSQLKSDKPIKGRKESIVIDTLDNFVEKNIVKRIDFIKCDTEGSELFVFKGAQKTLEKLHPTILVEIAEPHTVRFNYKGNDVLNFLKELGYKTFCYNYEQKKLIETNIIEMKPDGHVWSLLDENLSNNNYFFIHKSKLESYKLN